MLVASCKYSSSMFGASLRHIVRSFSTRPPKQPVKAWSMEDKKKLVKLVEIHGKTWAIIKDHFEGRSTTSITSKYKYLVEKSGGDVHSLLKTPRAPITRWTQTEDDLLLKLSTELNNNWSEMAGHFPKRSSSDLAQRHYKLTVDDLADANAGAWKKEETEQLVELVAKYGRQWGKISQELQTRTRLQCAVRYRHMLSKHSLMMKELNPFSVDKIKKAVSKYGADDFKKIREVVKLPISVDNLRMYYWAELDPKIDTSEWTEDEIVTMREMFEELDGAMELVQTRLPKKRKLSEMWDHL